MRPTTTCPAERYLRMLTELAPPDSLLDVRYALPDGGMARFFLKANVNPHDAAQTLTRIGRNTDVYIGCAPRTRPSGTRQDIAPTPLLWADCDGPDALDALADFPIAPSMIVTSGTPNPSAPGANGAAPRENAHAYWPLTQPLDLDTLEHTNRRLAHALHADPSCTDAARILRPPGTLNFKHNPPRPVALHHYNPIRHHPKDLLAILPQLPTPPAPPVHHVTRRNQDPARGTDPLQAIAPGHYIRILTSQTPARNGKIHCPFHDDKRPSLHAYPTPAQGWTCFACTTTTGRRLGGDIYTLASLLWSIPNRGKSHYELRDRLDELFGIRREVEGEQARRKTR